MLTRLGAVSAAIVVAALSIVLSAPPAHADGFTVASCT